MMFDVVMMKIMWWGLGENRYIHRILQNYVGISILFRAHTCLGAVGDGTRKIFQGYIHIYTTYSSQDFPLVPLVLCHYVPTPKKSPKKFP